MGPKKTNLREPLLQDTSDKQYPGGDDNNTVDNSGGNGAGSTEPKNRG